MRISAAHIGDATRSVEAVPWHPSMSAKRWRILRILRERGAQSAAVICALTGVTIQATFKLLGKMAVDGLVASAPRGYESACKWEPTPRGFRLLNAADGPRGDLSEFSASRPTDPQAPLR